MARQRRGLACGWKDRHSTATPAWRGAVVSIDDPPPPTLHGDIVMFQRILVPTDGSDLSKKAVRAAIRLAAGTGARLVAFHAIPKFRTFTLDAQMLEDTAGEYRAVSVARARTLLAAVAAEARKAGVACDTAHASSDQPWAAIIREAKRKRCDLVLMASHGRRGLQGVLLGSETQKVLTHSSVPVLVYR